MADAATLLDQKQTPPGIPNASSSWTHLIGEPEYARSLLSGCRKWEIQITQVVSAKTLFLDAVSGIRNAAVMELR